MRLVPCDMARQVLTHSCELLDLPGKSSSVQIVSLVPSFISFELFGYILMAPASRVNSSLYYSDNGMQLTEKLLVLNIPIMTEETSLILDIKSEKFSVFLLFQS